MICISFLSLSKTEVEKEISLQTNLQNMTILPYHFSFAVVISSIYHPTCLYYETSTPILLFREISFLQSLAIPECKIIAMFHTEGFKILHGFCISLEKHLHDLGRWKSDSQISRLFTKTAMFFFKLRSKKNIFHFCWDWKKTWKIKTLFLKYISFSFLLF